jgi:hypothetical protein
MIVNTIFNTSLAFIDECEIRNVLETARIKHIEN